MESCRDNDVSSRQDVMIVVLRLNVAIVDNVITESFSSITEHSCDYQQTYDFTVG